jgi:hypothetical protein
MSFRALLAAVALCAVALPVGAVPQSRPSATKEAAVLADGWARLARGDADGAAVVAGQALARQPLSSAALVLAIDADLARGGASAALSTYEKWLGTRKLEDAYALRRVARALLASTEQEADRAARVDAWRALAADGDLAAAGALRQALSSDTSALAAAGDERAVTEVIAQLRTVPAGKVRLIAALAESGSKTAIPDLTALLGDQSDATRAAAADALGRLGATEAIPALRQLLKDQFLPVRLKAAGALYRLDDSSGLPFLTELTESEHATIRVAAAEQLASHPDARWQSLVRSLAEDPNPLVRLDAATLIAPYDEALAKSVLGALTRDANPAIRDAASAAVVERPAADIATLRALLRSGDLRVRVKAAGRLLELTR